MYRIRKDGIIFYDASVGREITERIHGCVVYLYAVVGRYYPYTMFVIAEKSNHFAFSVDMIEQRYLTGD